MAQQLTAIRLPAGFRYPNADFVIPPVATGLIYAGLFAGADLAQARKNRATGSACDLVSATAPTFPGSAYMRCLGQVSGIRSGIYDQNEYTIMALAKTPTAFDGTNENLAACIASSYTNSGSEQGSAFNLAYYNATQDNLVVNGRNSAGTIEASGTQEAKGAFGTPRILTAQLSLTNIAVADESAGGTLINKTLQANRVPATGNEIMIGTAAPGAASNWSASIDLNCMFIFNRWLSAAERATMTAYIRLVGADAGIAAA